MYMQAVCGSPQQHIFHSSLPESLSSCKPFKPVKPNDHSFIEDLVEDGSLNHQNLIDYEKNEDSAVNRSDWSKRNKGFCSMNSESLQLCTEGLGFESLDGVEDLKNDTSNSRLDSSVTSMHSIGSRQCFKKAKNCIRSFPPPISSLGRTGKALVRFKSYRQDGRFVLQVVRIPKQDYLHAYREDGRLRLSFVQPDEENDEEDDQIHEEGNDADNDEYMI